MDSDTQIKRAADGTLLPGSAPLNPEGNNGHIEGWQPYGVRLKTWLGKSGEEFEQLAGDPAALKKRPLIDIVCAQHVRDMTDSGTPPEVRHKAREAAIDRMDGKPKQTVAHGGDPDNPTPISMDGVFTLTFGTEDNDGIDPTESDGDKPTD